MPTRKHLNVALIFMRGGGRIGAGTKNISGYGFSNIQSETSARNIVGALKTGKSCASAIHEASQDKENGVGVCLSSNTVRYCERSVITAMLKINKNLTVFGWTALITNAVITVTMCCRAAPDATEFAAITLQSPRQESRLRLSFSTKALGQLKITAYRALREQTDNSPYYTSTNEHVRAGGCAVSRDLLCGACRKLHRRCNHPEYGKKLHYGDWLYTSQFGYRQVNDVMGDYTTQKVNGKKVRIPIRQHIDIFVWTYEQEKAVQVQRGNVYRVDASEVDREHFDVSANGTTKGAKR